MDQRRLKEVRKRQDTKDKSSKDASFSYVPRKFKRSKYSVLKGRGSLANYIRNTWEMLQNKGGSMLECVTSMVTGIWGKP